jgi:hypothetical protein
MPKPNPVPKEGCSHEEAITYLENHIQNLDEQIETIKALYEDADKDSSLRGWAMDRAIRHYEKSKEPVDFMALQALSDKIYEYAKIKRPE